MDKLGNSLNNTMKSLMVRCMLNPDNKDFYIGTLTTDRVREILVNFNDDEFTQLFWSAFEVAQALFIQQTNELKVYFDKTIVCPECGCLTYVPGVACPNCEHTEY